jgi:hypothetical protein
MDPWLLCFRTPTNLSAGASSTAKAKFGLEFTAGIRKKNPVKAFSEFEFGKQSFSAKIWACWITNQVAG